MVKPSEEAATRVDYDRLGLAIEDTDKVRRLDSDKDTYGLNGATWVPVHGGHHVICGHVRAPPTANDSG